ncbi:MAG: hypothetical protein CL678_02345 [Bdellovibrionaceae bacterium]|nr:hypothetical protein [Halobacteriovorax sp.]MBN20100.1 hypothetical protein [Pseudobdellovibrionaceae bacterium]|tara:strand:- start:47834 stop:50416 length:2583 start_codon:yes stop_codon:yes gene_type:complete
MTNFLKLLHPLFVHFPIAISVILAVIILNKRLREKFFFELQVINFLFILVTAISGYFYLGTIDYSAPQLLEHKLTSYYLLPIILVFTVLLYFKEEFRKNPIIVILGTWIQFLIIGYISFLGATSHYGNFFTNKKLKLPSKKFHHSNASIKHLEEKVMPILRHRCLKCHNSKTPSKELRMDNSIQFLIDLQRKNLISNCNKNESEFYKRLTRHDDSKKMMPLNRGPLSEHEIKIIGDWLDQTCELPKDLYKSLDHWSFKKVIKPKIEKRSKSLNPIDYFLKTQNIESASEDLIKRRIYSSLTGLVYVEKKKKKEKVEQVIKNALDSQHFGERIASYWLRLHRYADTIGGDQDSYRLGSFQYRDYIIKAFNKDTGLNNIIFNQLAADQVHQREEESLHATGFHLVGEIDPEEAGKDLVPTKLTYSDDVLGTTFAINLGLDTRCARCHDHRSNPITQKQYYQLSIPFLSVKDDYFSLQRFEEDEKELSLLESQYKEKDLKKYILETQKFFSKRRSISLKNEKDISETFIRVRGEPFRHGESVKFALPDFYKGDKTNLDFWKEYLQKNKGLISTNNSHRAVLGEWIINEQFGVGLHTARNLVNHFWALFFGRYLIENPGDQNFNSKEPKNSKLLNYLAHYLIENNWSAKKLSKLIVSSNAFQAKSTGYNKLEFNTYKFFKAVPKFPGEIRDQILQLSGQLVYQSFGPGIQGKISEELMQQISNDFWKEVYSKKEEFKKSIYLFKKRSLINPQLYFIEDRISALPRLGSDKPRINDEISFFINSDLVKNAAHSVSKKLILEKREYEEQYFHQAFLKILGRKPNEEEVDSIQAYIKNIKINKKSIERVLSSFCQSMFSLNEFRYIH